MTIFSVSHLNEPLTLEVGLSLHRLRCLPLRRVIVWIPLLNALDISGASEY
jgi:hypothetical protein